MVIYVFMLFLGVVVSAKWLVEKAECSVPVKRSSPQWHTVRGAGCWTFLSST